MFKTVKVKDVSISGIYGNPFISYEDTDGSEKFAACTEQLCPKIGDTVELYCDEYVNYRGFGAMALKVVA